MAAKKKASAKGDDAKAAPKKAPAGGSDLGLEKIPEVQVAALNVSQETLEGSPERLMKFLSAAVSPEIFVQLEGIGYTEAVHAEAWNILQSNSRVPSGGNTASSKAASAALAEVDGWDEKGFRIVRASLQHRLPKVYAFLVDGIGPETGPAALVGVSTLLDRLDALERPGAPAGADVALKLLERRKLTKAVRANLRDKIRVARTPETLERVSEEAVAAAAEDRLKMQIAARVFMEEWGELARTEITRRDYLIRLGLAQRQSRTPKSDGEAVLGEAPKPKKRRRKK